MSMKQKDWWFAVVMVGLLCSAYINAKAQTCDGSATLSWTAPTERTDGTPLTAEELAWYWVHYSEGGTALDQKFVVPGEDLGAVVPGLCAGDWSFAVKAEDSEGRQSAFSNIADKTIVAGVVPRRGTLDEVR